MGETRSIWALRLLKQLFTPVKSAEKTTSPQVAIAAQQKQTLHTVLMVSAHCRAKRITWLESEVAQAHLRQAAVPDVERGMNGSLLVQINSSTNLMRNSSCALGQPMRRELLRMHLITDNCKSISALNRCRNGEASKSNSPALIVILAKLLNVFLWNTRRLRNHR